MSLTTPDAIRPGPGRLLTVLAAGFAPLVLLQTSLNLYVANAAHLVGGKASLAVLGLLCLCAWAGLYSALHRGRGPGRVVWALFSAYALFFVLRDVAFPFSLAPLDGKTPFQPPRKRYIALELATLTLCAGLTLFVSRRKVVVLAGIFAAVFGASTCVTAAKHRSLLWPAATARQGEATALVPAPERQAGKPDIYHLLFDGYQTVEYEWVRREKGTSYPFDDFVFYRNNISNHNVTKYSVPSLFTGTIDPPASEYSVWQQESVRSGLVPVLKQNGYRARILTVVGQSCPTCVSDEPCLSREEMYARQAERTLLGEDFLLTLQLRWLPSFLGVKVWERRDQRQVPASTDFSYYSVQQFNDMVDGIKRTKSGDNYTHVHLLCPHAPNVLDEDGNYVGVSRGSRMGQVRLVDRLVGKLVAELKRLGRYDSSVLVVHADHGWGYHPNVAEQRLVNCGKELFEPPTGMSEEDKHHAERYPLHYAVGKTQGLLLVKPCGHKGGKVSEAPSQLTDLPPTILGMAGIRRPAGRFPDGVDLLASPPKSDRVRRVWITPDRWPAPDKPWIQQEYVIRDGRFEKARLRTLPLTSSPR